MPSRTSVLSLNGFCEQDQMCPHVQNQKKVNNDFTNPFDLYITVCVIYYSYEYEANQIVEGYFSF